MACDKIFHVWGYLKPITSAVKASLAAFPAFLLHAVAFQQGLAAAVHVLVIGVGQEFSIGFPPAAFLPVAPAQVLGQAARSQISSLLGKGSNAGLAV